MKDFFQIDQTLHQIWRQQKGRFDLIIDVNFKGLLKYVRFKPYTLGAAAPAKDIEQASIAQNVRAPLKRFVKLKA